MADEPKNVEPQPDPEPKIDRKLVESHPAFLGLKEQASAAKAALDELKAAQSAAKKEAEEKALAEANNWTELKKRTEAEIASLKAGHERELITLKADAALVGAGLQHAVTRNGYVSSYVAIDPAARPQIEEWVKQIREDEGNAIFFKGAAPAIGGGPAGKASPGGASLSAVELLKKDINGPDRKLATEARAKAMTMIAAGLAAPADFVVR